MLTHGTEKYLRKRTLFLGKLARANVTVAAPSSVYLTPNHKPSNVSPPHTLPSRSARIVAPLSLPRAHLVISFHDFFQHIQLSSLQLNCFPRSPQPLTTMGFPPIFGGGFDGPCQGATFSKPKDERLDPAILPNTDGYFGDYGGAFLPPPLVPIIDEIKAKYNELKEDPSFWAELRLLEKHFTGRPSPILHCERLSEKIGGAQIYLKREDLNHTGAHKINHCLGEALLAKKMGKKKLIAETGAGQHGVALATAAALVGLECDIYMGEVDMAKERPNVVRMKILGANVIPASHGLKTLKEAVDAAFGAYMEDPVTMLL